MFKKYIKGHQFAHFVILHQLLLSSALFILHNTLYTSKMTVEYITLQPSGDKMPLIGFGCWKVQPDVAPETIYNAIRSGYRLIDSASNYKNEQAIGKGIKMAIDEGIVKREDLFVTTKLWSTYHKKEHVRKACEKQLEDLGLDYVDMFLVHCKFVITCRKDYMANICLSSPSSSQVCTY